jgi:hypothetical protein
LCVFDALLRLFVAEPRRYPPHSLQFDSAPRNARRTDELEDSSLFIAVNDIGMTGLLTVDKMGA